MKEIRIRYEDELEEQTISYVANKIITENVAMNNYKEYIETFSINTPGVMEVTAFVRNTKKGIKCITIYKEHEE